MKKLLVVYNTCGMGGSNVAYYVDSIRSLLSQSVYDSWGDDYKIALSGCMLHQGVKDSLINVFSRHLSYNFIDENYPLSVTFNDTVAKCVEHYGEFEGYLYLDSGITFWDPSKRYDAMQLFWDSFKQHENGVIAAMPSNDDGSSWWGIQYQPNVDYEFKVPKTTNMHAQIFPNEWRIEYNHILPDIFASNTMESVFPFMASAIHKPFVMTQKIHLLHNHSMDQASIGSRREDQDRIPCSKVFQTPGLLFKTKRDMDERYAKGQQYGFGYEGCSEFWRHDPAKFVDGICQDPKLKEFLRDEMFLTKEEFDYSHISRQWIPGR